jgi:hypothetical protein
MCHDDAFPDETMDGSGNAAGCTCLAKLAVGTDCWASFECQTRVCGEDMTCSAKLANGEDCDDDDQCVSGYCDPVSWACAAPPVCT